VKGIKYRVLTIFRGGFLARGERVDRQLKMRMDELEKSLHMLRVVYNKYFSGIESVEPVREKDAVRRTLIEMSRLQLNTSREKFRFRQLKAKSVTIDSWISRSTLQIERGTHPKMKFRTQLAERRRAEGGTVARETTRGHREDAALTQVVDAYMIARKRTGMSMDIDPSVIQERLRKQAREVKSRYRCKSVKFKVSIVGGKVKLTATPKK
jgi:hypothetical protein